MAPNSDDDVAEGDATDLALAAFALARRFAQGGTLWCWSPGAPHHAQHVAVEFVHPVIAGTRALPAVALVGDEGADVLRPLARSGDVLLVVADAAAPISKTLKRAEAWGLTVIWLGVGRRPDRSPASHLLWLSEDSSAWHDGRVVLGYHVLWELTHVCFEHPGLLRETEDPCANDGSVGSVCITCSDEGRLAEVVTGAGDSARVRTAAGIETVSTAMIPPVTAGDLVLIHAGTAISLVGE